mgnify:CR=1 FL=1
MALRLLSTLSLALLGSLVLVAASREDQAKKYAADLMSKNAKDRLTAVTELGKLGSLQKKLTVPYVSDLMKVLTDNDPKIRSEAARVIGLIDVEDKKGAVEKIAGLLKNEKVETAREGQETGLGELGATSEDDAVKKMARDALMEARKKYTDSKREQKVIQAALQLITGKKKN